jgi:hypothetical protein
MTAPALTTNGGHDPPWAVSGVMSKASISGSTSDPPAASA